MEFKEMVEEDIEKVFLNPEEFGENHVVNGIDMMIIIDDMEMVEREKRVKSNDDGIHRKQILFYVAAKEFGALPATNREITVDGKKYRITDAVSEGEIYSISGEAKRS